MSFSRRDPIAATAAATPKRHSPSYPPSPAVASSAAAAAPTSTGNRPPSWTIDDFELGPKLGEGRFGRVYLAKERSTRYPCVLKCVQKDSILYRDFTTQMRREIELQRYASSVGPSATRQHIVKLLAYFWDATYLYMVLEYCEGGDLLSIMKNQPNKRYIEDETLAGAIVGQLALGLKHLHRLGIVHRDIKPENCLFRRGLVKLGDFTWAVHCQGAERRMTICGTLDYLSPEVVTQTTGHDAHSDMWGLGVVLFEMLTGSPPFERALAPETCVSIQKGDYFIPSFVPPLARDLIQRLLVTDPEERLSPDQVLQHPFVTGSGGFENPVLQQHQQNSATAAASASTASIVARALPSSLLGLSSASSPFARHANRMTGNNTVGSRIAGSNATSLDFHSPLAGHHQASSAARSPGIWATSVSSPRAGLPPLASSSYPLHHHHQHDQQRQEHPPRGEASEHNTERELSAVVNDVSAATSAPSNQNHSASFSHIAALQNASTAVFPAAAGHHSNNQTSSLTTTSNNVTATTTSAVQQHPPHRGGSSIFASSALHEESVSRVLDMSEPDQQQQGAGSNQRHRFEQRRDRLNNNGAQQAQEQLSPSLVSSSILPSASITATGSALTANSGVHHQTNHDDSEASSATRRQEEVNGSAATAMDSSISQQQQVVSSTTGDEAEDDSPRSGHSETQEDQHDSEEQDLSLDGLSRIDATQTPQRGGLMMGDSSHDDEDDKGRQQEAAKTDDEERSKSLPKTTAFNDSPTDDDDDEW